MADISQDQVTFKSNLRILLVDDSSINQTVTKIMFTRLGIALDVTSNGQEGVEALKKVPYDLVLMDIQMPVMDGYEATRLIRQGNSGILNPNVPIVAVTAHVMPEDREKCLAAGMNDHLPKPVKRSQIVSALVEFLPESAVIKHSS